VHRDSLITLYIALFKTKTSTYRLYNISNESQNKQRLAIISVNSFNRSEAGHVFFAVRDENYLRELGFKRICRSCFDCSLNITKLVDPEGEAGEPETVTSPYSKKTLC
jgi:hypothetical protein